MNIVVMIGSVAMKPELARTKTGKDICMFKLGVERPRGEDVDFFDVVTWGSQAEMCADRVQVGQRLSIEGALHHVTFVNDGKRESKMEIVATRITILGQS